MYFGNVAECRSAEEKEEKEEEKKKQDGTSDCVSWPQLWPDFVGRRFGPKADGFGGDESNVAIRGDVSEPCLAWCVSRLIGWGKAARGTQVT